MPTSFTSPTTWNLPLDTLLDRLAPPNFTHRLPFPLAHLLGHRTHPARPTGNVLTAIFALLGPFIAILTIGGLFITPAISSHHPPLVLGSFGAATILHFSTPLSPLAQPRNAIFGTLISTTIAVALVKALLQRPADPPALLYILTAGLATGLSSAAMLLSGTTYPPAGATALLAVVDPPTRALGWWALALAVLGSLVCVIEGCLVVNLGPGRRRYPLWWWRPPPLSPDEGDERMRRRRRRRIHRGGQDGRDVEKAGEDARVGSGDGGEGRGSAETEGDEEDVFAVIFTKDRIYLPSVQRVAVEKAGVLRMLQDRLEEGDGGRQGPEIGSSLWDSRSEESIRELVAKEQRERESHV